MSLIYFPLFSKKIKKIVNKKNRKKINDDVDIEIMVYDSKKAQNLYIFFRDNYIWEHINKWQNYEIDEFPNDLIIKNEDFKIDFENYFENIYLVERKKEVNDIINDIMNYSLQFDIKNKDKYMYDERIRKVNNQISLYIPIKNANVQIFNILNQPLFTYFSEKNIPNNAKNFLKIPSSVEKKTLQPIYDNYTDKNVNNDVDYLLFYNNKNVLIEKDGYSSSMSFPHMLCIPKKRIYNCITICDKNSNKEKKWAIELIKVMQNNVQKYFNHHFIECLAEFGTRAIIYKINNQDIIIDNYNLLEKTNIVKNFINILDKVYNENKNNKDELKIYKILLKRLINFDKNVKNKKLEFYFHIHPFIGIGHLHMHCLYPCLKGKSWNHFINQFIKTDDLIYLLKS